MKNLLTAPKAILSIAKDMNLNGNNIVALVLGIKGLSIIQEMIANGNYSLSLSVKNKNAFDLKLEPRSFVS